MSSWYSNLLTKTSSQISNLRSTLLSSEADGDTEDDTHVCRVLRNYYTEKGRPLPQWLPPDPKAAQQVPQTLYAQPQVGSRYGGLSNPQQQQNQQPGAGGLSSLWDNNPGQGQAQPPPLPPQSLRVGRVPVGGYAAAGQAGGREEQLGRPGPGARAGSYQPPVSVSQPGGGSAQDRLKQRLWGARTTSPGSQNAQGPFQPPPPSGGQNYSGGGGGGGGGYGGGGGGGGGGSDKPYVGANAPWSTGGDDFMGGGGMGGGGGGGSNARQGLPSNGPRRQGLPNGPRGYR